MGCSVDNSPSARRRALAALLLLVPVPTISTWFGLVGHEGTALGQWVFSAGKVWIVLLPVVWLLLVDRGRLRFPLPRRRGMAAACVTGIAIFAAIGVAYLLVPREWFNPEEIRTQAFEIGLDTRLKYVLFMIGFVCIVNSLLEEYVWRWFVFTRLETLMPRAAAVIASGVCFTLHHIVALDAYFDWEVVALGSFGVCVGGATWSWIYLRYRNIWAAWVSHVFADLIIFIIGWQLIFMGGLPPA